MTGKASVRAGLIGAAVLVVLTLLSLIPVPFLPCVCCGLDLLAYVGIGALAAYYLAAPRQMQTAAGAGAVAGLIAGAATGIAQIIIAVIQFAIMGPETVVSALDPDIIRQLIEAGIDPEVFAAFTGVGGVALGGALCCLGSLAFGAGLGALGAIIFAAVKQESRIPVE